MKLDDQKIVQAIAEAESQTSGEVRVHVTKFASKNILEKSKIVFEKLGMTKTQERNGILFFIAEVSKCFSILGDKGIHEKVHQEFWEELSATMQDHFRKKEFTQGLCEAIRECGEKLKLYFPYQRDDVDELSNQVSRDS